MEAYIGIILIITLAPVVKTSGTFLDPIQQRFMKVGVDTCVSPNKDVKFAEAFECAVLCAMEADCIAFTVNETGGSLHQQCFLDLCLDSSSGRVDDVRREIVFNVSTHRYTCLTSNLVLRQCFDLQISES